MAVFDKDQRRFVVRVVYDGPELAGKTTNLQRLSTLLATRRGELTTPVEIQGRTAYFDWLTVESGFVSGMPLVGQLLTVPGQAAREPRRMRLLRGADVVVFVVHSTLEGTARARPMLAALRAVQAAAGPGAPALVVQANHQDRPEAMPPDAVAAALDLPPDVPVIAARAHEGAGVRETVVVALRAAIAEVHRRVRDEGIEALAGSVEHIDALLDTLMDPDLPRGEEPSSEPRRPTIPAAVPPANDAEVAATMVASSRVPALRRFTPPFPMPVVPRRPQSSEAPSLRSTPPLPNADAPSGCVWPVLTGRELLREANFTDLQRRDDLVGAHGAADGSGRSDVMLFEAGEHFLKTSPRRRYEDGDEARAALVLLARKKALLGPLLPERTVLALAQAEDESYWLWTVTPWMETLRAAMNRAAGRADAEEMAAALGWFARAAALSAQLASRKRLRLDVSPTNFAMLRGDVLYIDDDIDDGAEMPALGHALIQRFEEYAAFPKALAAYAGAIEESLSAHLTRADAEAVGLEASLRGASPRSAEARAAVARMLEILPRLG